MNLRKIFIIARREYAYNVRRRIYLFTAFVIPIMSIGLSILATSFSTSQLDDTGSFQRVGIIDAAGILKGFTPPPPYVIMSSPDDAAAQLRSGTLEVYFVLPADFLRSGQADSYSRASLPPGLNVDLLKVVKQALAANADPNIVARLQDPSAHTDVRLVDDPQVYDESILLGAFFAPFIFAMVLLLSIMTTSQFLMSGVVEEKENRMMELLATSSRPTEMLWGKILGLGALGLTQLLIWAVIGLGFVMLRSSEKMGTALANLQVTPTTLLLMLAYFILGYAFNGAVMAGIGASVNAEQESRQISSLFGLLNVVPLFAIVAFIQDSNGPLPTLLSMIPMTAPLSMVMRLTFGTVPPFQILLSLTIMTVSVVIVAWLSARVFRLGMLSYGKRLGVRDIVRAFREGNTVVTSTAGQEATQTP